MSADPLVSIGLPVYNGERYLDEALRSLRKQTYEHLEIIVADNASTDGTESIVRDHCAQDPRIRYLRSEENVGAARNFNRAFEAASGPLFKWAADDDVCDGSFIERCVALLQDDRVAWAFTRVRFVGPDDQPIRTTTSDADGVMSYLTSMTGAPVDGPTRASPEPHERLRSVLMQSVGEGNWDVFGVARSDVLRRTGLQGSVYGADRVLVGELAMAGLYAEVPEPLFLGRLHDAASGAIGGARAQQAWIDPRRRRTFPPARVRLLGAWLAAIGRADLPTSEKARCVSVVVRHSTQLHRLRRVVSTALHRQGTGGGYLPFLEPEQP